MSMIKRSRTNITEAQIGSMCITCSKCGKPIVCTMTKTGSADELKQICSRCMKNDSPTNKKHRNKH